MTLYGKLIDCTKCGERFVLDDSCLGSIKEGDLEVTYFSCPACGERYHVLTSDSKMRELIERRKAVQEKILAAHAKKFQERTFKKYMREYDKIKREQEAMVPALKAAGEKILHRGECDAVTELHNEG